MDLVIFVFEGEIDEPVLSFCPEEIMVGDSACSQVRASASETLMPVRRSVRRKR